MGKLEAFTWTTAEALCSPKDPDMFQSTSRKSISATSRKGKLRHNASLLGLNLHSQSGAL